jgi:hypothetical protein
MKGARRDDRPGRVPQPAARRPERLLFIDLRWPHLAAATGGQYAELRLRLNDYADRMAACIDGNPSDPISRTHSAGTHMKNFRQLRHD